MFISCDSGSVRVHDQVSFHSVGNPFLALNKISPSHVMLCKCNACFHLQPVIIHNVIDHVDWAMYCTADVHLSVAEEVGINIDRCTEITMMPDIELYQTFNGRVSLVMPHLLIYISSPKPHSSSEGLMSTNCLQIIDPNMERHQHVLLTCTLLLSRCTVRPPLGMKLNLLEREKTVYRKLSSIKI